MSDSAAGAAAAVLAKGLGKKSPSAKTHLVIWPPSADAQGGPRARAAPAVPPLVPEPLPPRWLSCLLALCHFASVVAQHGSLHTRPVLHEARIAFMHPQRLATQGITQRTSSSVFPVQNTSLFNHLSHRNRVLPQSVLVALRAQELHVTKCGCARVQAVFSSFYSFPNTVLTPANHRADRYFMELLQ